MAVRADNPRQSVLDSVFVSDDPLEDLRAVARSESRVFVLYATQQEAVAILREATKLGITGKAYVWIVAQSVVGASLDPAPDELPLGMLGVHFRSVNGKKKS